MRTMSGKKIKILSILLLLSSLLHSQSSSNKDYIRSVQEADQYFYFSQDYESAAKMYAALLKNYPDNNNLQAKLGISYLNVDGMKAEALSLLKKASANIVKDEKDYIEYGKAAPIDTYFYLAHAYQVNDSLGQAIKVFSEVRRKMTSDQYFRLEYIENQVKACQYASESEKKNIRIGTDLFVSWLSEYPGASNPVLSLDDSVFVFTIRKDESNQILCSYKDGTGWKRPVDITKQLSGFDRLWTNSITGDGRMLVLYMDDGADGNLYYSHRSGNEWSKVRKFGKTINTKFWEAHGFITPDGKRLYFSSNRDGGVGELDIWMSDQQPDGSWGKAVNLGKKINTPYNENTPFYDTLSSTLYFSSEGHLGMGGYDMFMSGFRRGEWSEPIGLPYPVNSTGDNTFLIYSRRLHGYLTSLVDDKKGIRNIYTMVPLDSLHENITAVGNIDLQDGMNVVPRLADVSIKSSDSISQWRKLPMSGNGKFEFTALKGNYKLHIAYSGYKTDTISLSIPENFSGSQVSVNSSLVPEKVSSGDFLVMKNILFEYNSYELNDQAKTELEKIRRILSSHPGLRIEVTGYTDNKGDRDYNMKLSGLRADAVVAYLESSDCGGAVFSRKAAGASSFIALNSRPDGSDYPEGRQLNRRVSLGIINPQTGITIVQESYAPPQLRYPYSVKYCIVLLRSQEKFFPDYFREFSLNELLFVRPVIRDSMYYYVLGDFANRSDADSYLAFVRQKGFKEGYVVDQYELAGEPKQLISQSDAGKKTGKPGFYVIQLRASTSQINLDAFKGLEKVKEVKGRDKYFRYVYGEYTGFSKAMAALVEVRRSGYKEAFIKEYSLLINQ
ncbi:MAG TPA: OmpA family protein [Bacteroidales bacterium]|nr:OmpA family protein [Bacteroidales bacterium]